MSDANVMVNSMWKTVPTVETLECSKSGLCRLSSNKRLLKPSVKYGYMVIRHYVGGVRKHYHLHRLVAMAFRGLPENSALHAAHYDGDKLNNSANNIYWATAQENISDRERHGRTMRGDNHYARVLSSSEIPKIRKLLSAGMPQKDIAKIYGVTKYTISDIKRGKTWNSVK